MIDERFAGLPAGELLSAGLADLEREVPTSAAFIVASAWPRLEPLGLVTREAVERVRIAGEDLEHSAYRMLQATHGREAHARLMALNAELESALNALEREQRRIQ